MSRRCPLPQDRQPRAEASKEFTSRPACSRGPLELGFHRQLSADRIFVALNGKDSEIAARAAEADEAIPMSEIALDKRLVPCLRMADIADRKVEMLRPEEWDHHKRLVFTQHIRGRNLALPLSDNPMFNANVLASMGIGPASNVARGENVGIGGLQPRID
jgi:hypothetical protein